MNHGIIISLATLDLILGILLYVTIRQIQCITRDLSVICDIASTADAKADANDEEINKVYKEIDLCKRDTATTYELAAACRNELARMHMVMRKETTND